MKYNINKKNNWGGIYPNSDLKYNRYYYVQGLENFKFLNRIINFHKNFYNFNWFLINILFLKLFFCHCLVCLHL